MKHTSKPIIFFGSGPVAKASLDHLAHHFDVAAIVTKPITRNEMLAGLPDIPTFTVTNRQELTSLLQSQPFANQLGVIVDFGIIVDQAVIEYFEMGIVNAHFSLLPEWRGADPITFAVLSGQPQTGVSLMLINAALDEGELLAQENLTVPPDATAETLTRDLVALSNDMLVRYLPLYTSGKLKPYPQDNTVPATYSRKLTKDDGLLDWHKNASQLEREIRAFTTWPKSRTNLGEIAVTITKAHVIPASENPGEFITDGKKQLAVACSEDALAIDELKPAGKNAMPIQAFLAGYGNRLTK